MEALAAISLAGNILQFVSLGVLCVKHVREYRDGTAARNHASLRDELAGLKKLTTQLQDTAVNQKPSQANRGLWTQAQRCQEIADRMLTEIDKLGIKDGPTSTWRALVRHPFIYKALDRLGGELNSVQSQLQLHITASQKEGLRELLENQHEILSSLDDVESSIMTKIVQNDQQPLRVDNDIILQQLQRLHTETVRTFTERLGSIQAQLEEINSRLTQLTAQTSSASSGEVGGRALWTAIADGDEASVNNLLQRGADTTFTDTNNESCLHLAARRGSVPILKSLLRHGPGLNVYSDQGITPLISATVAEKMQTADVLLGAGCHIDAPLRATRSSVSGVLDIDNRPTKGSTALFLAAQHGFTELVELFIKNGANVNVRTNNMFTPLHAAAIGGFPEIAQLLLDHGAEIEASTDGHFTPLIYAAHHGMTDVALVLLKNGANIEARKSLNMTALLEAFYKLRVQMIKLLLNYGASVTGELPPWLGQPSLLHWAIDINMPEVVGRLLEIQPDLGVWCRNSDKEELLRRSKGNAELASLLRL